MSLKEEQKQIGQKWPLKNKKKRENRQKLTRTRNNK